jgi:hypothetical protein
MEDLFIKKQYATIHEIKGLEHDNENEIRVYKNSPETFNFQIRTHKPITDNFVGVKRNMIANVSLTLEEIEQIYNYIKNYK